ncbi:MAG: glycoside hydrolase family 16 protein [Bacteroidota bacterium]
MYRLVLFFLILLLASGRIYSQEAKPASCDIYTDIPACPSNPAEKQGYYILLNQQFQNPSKYWNVSKPNDDKGCDFNFMRNQDNVTFTSSANLANTDVPLMGCPYSMGEIKTMTVDTANHTFKSYYFYGSGYLEAKVRQLYCSPGQGSAMWLWSVLDSDDPAIPHPNILDDNEIDIFETQPNDSADFNIAYHWRIKGSLAKAENFYRIHPSQSLFTNWTVFAVRWCRDSINWFVNNKLVKTMKMDDQPAGCTSGDPKSFMPPDGPFCIRFNSGPNTVVTHDSVIPSALTGHLEIEYVRVYKLNGEKASPIRFFSGTPNQVCISENSPETSNSILSANYYPDATYSWSSPAFEIQPFGIPNPQPQHHSGKVKIWLKPGVQANQAYPIVLTTVLPGHIEKDTAWYLVVNAAPPLPPDNFQASRIDGPLCIYEISHPIENFSTSSCEFFNDATQSWQHAPLRIVNGIRYAFFGRYMPQAFVPIKYREKNACGYSATRQSGKTIPVPPPGSCGW